MMRRSAYFVVLGQVKDWSAETKAASRKDETKLSPEEQEACRPFALSINFGIQTYSDSF
jgi:hypothetical protein